MNKQEDDKVIVKLKKEYLSSEREEKKRNRITFILGFCLFVSILIIIFLVVNYNALVKNSNNINNKTNEIKEILKSRWIYGNDYEDLDSVLDDKMYRGLTTFEDDPYTTYMSNNDMSYFSNTIDKVQLGIGISYYKEYNGYPYVLEVYKNSGAFNGGIKKGDRIVAIDQHDVSGCNDDQIKEYVLGDEGTFVEVAVNRNGSILTFYCERKYFDSTASAKLYGDVVVLTLSSFGTNSVETISNELKDYTNYHKLIIDLRNNSGGYQDSLLKIAALFLENDTLVMKELDKNGNDTEYYAKYDEHYYNFDNIVIITNENTASAAEVFAICMKEQHPNTTLVGNTTYGKGVVQSSFKLSDDSYVKVTISYWTSPNGVSIQGDGVKPDIELSLDDAFYRTIYDFYDGYEYKFDDVNGYITTISSILKYLGYPVGRTDGLFDKDFENALNQYKQEHGLEPNGILDKTTYQRVIDSFNVSERDDYLTYALDYINSK